MRGPDQQYTWRLSPTALERTGPADRHHIELVASVEPDVRRYLAVAIHNPDERAEAIADALTAVFEGAESGSTIESARVIALASARESSNRWKRRQRRFVSGEWSVGVDGGYFAVTIAVANATDHPALVVLPNRTATNPGSTFEYHL